MRSYAQRHHVGLIALMVALIGVPTAWALARNSVGSRQLRPNAVKRSDLANNAVKSPEVADGSLFSKDFAGGQIPAGPPGPAGSIPEGPPPTEIAGPISAAADSTPVELASVDFTGSEGHRILLSGGFNATCNPCGSALTPSLLLRRDGAGSPLVRRFLPTLNPTERAGATVAEVVVTPSVCGPCTFDIAIVVTPTVAASVIDTTDIRLAIVDLGPPA